MVKVSIIMPVHNGSWSIRQSIQSIQEQNFTDWELLVIDDHSTDDTIAIVNEIQDNRIRVMANPKSGVSSARNLGIEQAEGEYITFLDADDIMYANALGLRVNALDRNPDWSVVYCVTEMVDRDFKELGWQLPQKSQITFEDMTGNPTHINALMARANILKQYRFPEYLANGEDWLLNSRLLRSGMTWHLVEGARVCYRIHDQSTVMKDFLAHERSLETVLDIIYGEDDGCPNPLPQYRFGLLIPPKNIIKKQRYYNLLTNRLLEDDEADVIDSIIRRVKYLPDSPVDPVMVVTGIKYTYMRLRSCHADRWLENFQSERSRLQPHLERLREDLDDYVEIVEYVLQARSEDEINDLYRKELRTYDRAAGRLKILARYYARWPWIIAVLVIGLNVAATLDTPLAPLFALVSGVLLFGLLGHIATQQQHVRRR